VCADVWATYHLGDRRFGQQGDGVYAICLGRLGVKPFEDTKVVDRGNARQRWGEVAALTLQYGRVKKKESNQIKSNQKSDIKWVCALQAVAIVFVFESVHVRSL